MFSLELRCQAEQAEMLAADLWDWQPIAVSETQRDGATLLLAGFNADNAQDELLIRFADWQPIWRRDDTDWVAQTEQAWPPRYVGSRLVLLAPWDATATSADKLRIVMNPGMASGTGEHPCTQLALEALEHVVTSDARVADVGSGSGILAIAAAHLGAARVLALEPDVDAALAACGNIALNERRPLLAAGYADAVAEGWATVTVANISGTVLLSIMDDLLRITAPGGALVLTGFELTEARRLQELFPASTISQRNGWACVTTYLG